MNKLWLYALLLSVLFNSDACRRRQLVRAVPTASSEQGAGFVHVGWYQT
jgi:hypothetical protein